MNIFFLDKDLTKCAEYHMDKHVVKMIVETAQLLCGAHHLLRQDEVINGKLVIPYKLTHKNHPCAIWARKSPANYLCLCNLGLALCAEYTHRYGKRHKSQDVMEWCLANYDKLASILTSLSEQKDTIGFTEPAMAMPPEYKVESDVVQSYRNYYIGAKAGFATWKNRCTPYWFKPRQQQPVQVQITT